MHPLSLRFDDRRVEAAFLQSRGSRMVETLRSWYVLWSTLFVVKIAHICLAIAEAPEEWRSYSRGVAGLNPQIVDDMWRWRWRNGETFVLFVVACGTFFILLKVEDKVQAHEVGSCITSACFLFAAMSHCATWVEPSHDESLAPFADAATMMLFAIAAHLVHVPPLHKAIACFSSPFSHTLQPAYGMGREREAMVSWAAAALGVSIGYILEQSIRSLFVLERRQLHAAGHEQAGAGSGGEGAAVEGTGASTGKTASPSPPSAPTWSLEALLEALTRTQASGPMLIVVVTLLLFAVLQIAVHQLASLTGVPPRQLAP